MLSPEELRRAGGFHFEADRRRFVVARGLLRAILGAYLDDDPSQIVFRYSPHGKPELAGRHLHRLCFNVSHSRELGLLAVARSCPLGVDVEYRRQIPDLDPLAQSVMGDREYSVYCSLPSCDRLTAFLVAWTRKEAAMKALGEGLSRSPREITVAPIQGQSDRLHRLAGDDGEAHPILILDLPVASEYVAALAVGAMGWRHISGAPENGGDEPFRRVRQEGSWAPVPGSTGNDDPQIWALLAAPDGRTAYAGAAQGVYRSSDDGRTWLHYVSVP